MKNLDGRHPGTQQVARWFDYEHLTNGHARRISQKCHDLADEMLAELPDSPELTVGLRKLLEAKDAFVRSALG